MAKQKFFYLKIRVRLDKEVSLKKLVNIVEDIDFEIKSQTAGIKIVEAEISESAKDFDFEETF